MLIKWRSCSRCLTWRCTNHLNLRSLDLLCLWIKMMLLCIKRLSLLWLLYLLLLLQRRNVHWLWYRVHLSCLLAIWAWLNKLCDCKKLLLIASLSPSWISSTLALYFCLRWRLGYWLSLHIDSTSLSCLLIISSSWVPNLSGIYNCWWMQRRVISLASITRLHWSYLHIRRNSSSWSSRCTNRFCLADNWSSSITTFFV